MRLWIIDTTWSLLCSLGPSLLVCLSNHSHLSIPPPALRVIDSPIPKLMLKESDMILKITKHRTPIPVNRRVFMHVQLPFVCVSTTLFCFSRPLLNSQQGVPIPSQDCLLELILLLYIVYKIIPGFPNKDCDHREFENISRL